jgi:hypothetical protein
MISNNCGGSYGNEADKPTGGLVKQLGGQGVQARLLMRASSERLDHRGRRHRGAG